MTSNLSIQIEGLPEFINDMKKAGVNIKPLMNATLFNAVTITQKNIRGRAPHKTGSLQRSILTQVNYPSAKVTADEPYAIMVEDGTKAHIIRPSAKKALFWKGAMNPYKLIHHPGTKAQPFFAPGVDESKEPVTDQFMKLIERVLTTMAGR